MASLTEKVKNYKGLQELSDTKSFARPGNLGSVVYAWIDRKYKLKELQRTIYQVKSKKLFYFRNYMKDID